MGARLFVGALWQRLRSPTSRYALGTLLAAGLLLGVGGAFGFEHLMGATNTNDFCTSCHELAENAYREFQGTPHHTNPTGVTATCGDCHVPREFGPKMWRKMRAVGEVYHHFAGTISTPEKYDAHRMRMAQRTWDEMRENDSRACRYCHSENAWDLSLQSEKAQQFHSTALSHGKTCISCHKGLAHELPAGIRADSVPEEDEF